MECCTRSDEAGEGGGRCMCPSATLGLALCPANGCVDGNKLIYSTCVRDGDTRLRIKCLNIKRKKEISDRQIFFYLLIEGVIFTAATYVNKDCVYILTRVLCNHTVLIKYERGRGGEGAEEGKKSRPRSSVSWDSFGPCWDAARRSRLQTRQGCAPDPVCAAWRRSSQRRISLFSR